jgi:hypothetical protein
MQHLGPRNGAAVLEALPSSSNIAAPFLGPVLGPIFGTTKEQQELLDGPAGPDFVHLLAPAIKPPWPHTSI